MILEHSKAPRNFRKPAAANQHAEGYNPLCGDRCTVYHQHGRRRDSSDIGFQGSGCAISRASASMMTQILKGKTQGRGGQALRGVPRSGDRQGGRSGNARIWASWRCSAGVSKFPARVKCATLAWHTLQSALEEQAGHRLHRVARGIQMTAPFPTNQNTAPIAGPFREEMIWQQFKTVRDPEIPVDIVEPGPRLCGCGGSARRRRPAHRRAHVAHRARLQHVRRDQGRSGAQAGRAA